MSATDPDEPIGGHRFFFSLAQEVSGKANFSVRDNKGELDACFNEPDWSVNKKRTSAQASYELVSATLYSSTRPNSSSQLNCLSMITISRCDVLLWVVFWVPSNIYRTSHSTRANARVSTQVKDD